MCSVYHLGHELKPISAERQKEKVLAGGLIERNLKKCLISPVHFFKDLSVQF